jgi:hypothetical protein
MKILIGILIWFSWLAGIAIAKGFWSTLFAVLVPLWAWYLVVERIVDKIL